MPEGFEVPDHVNLNLGGVANDLLEPHNAAFGVVRNALNNAAQFQNAAAHELIDRLRIQH